MTNAFNNVLEQYRSRAQLERSQREREGAAVLDRIDDFLLEIGEGTARLLQALIAGRGAKHIVELGTSYGFSTLFLAQSAKDTGGCVTTIEISAAKQAYAREMIGEAGLRDQVEWRCGDAVELLDQIDGEIDFVLIDLWKDLYVPCLEVLYPKLANHAILVADNMLEPVSSRAEAEAYRAAVQAKPDLKTMLLPIGSGIEVSCLWRGEA